MSAVVHTSALLFSLIVPETYCQSLDICSSDDCSWYNPPTNVIYVCTNTADSCTISMDSVSLNGDPSFVAGKIYSAAPITTFDCNGEGGCNYGEFHCGNELPPNASVYGLTETNFSGTINDCYFDCDHIFPHLCEDTNFYCSGDVVSCHAKSSIGDTLDRSLMNCQGITNPNAVCRMECDSNSCDNAMMDCRNTMATCSATSAKVTIETSSPTAAVSTTPTLFPTATPTILPTTSEPSVVPTKNTTVGISVRINFQYELDTNDSSNISIASIDNILTNIIDSEIIDNAICVHDNNYYIKIINENESNILINATMFVCNENDGNNLIISLNETLQKEFIPIIDNELNIYIINFNVDLKVAIVSGEESEIVLTTQATIISDTEFVKSNDNSPSPIIIIYISVAVILCGLIIVICLIVYCKIKRKHISTDIELIIATNIVKHGNDGKDIEEENDKMEKHQFAENTENDSDDQMYINKTVVQTPTDGNVNDNEQQNINGDNKVDRNNDSGTDDNDTDVEQMYTNSNQTATTNDCTRTGDV